MTAEIIISELIITTDSEQEMIQPHDAAGKPATLCGQPFSVFR
jgi:hypothetical protein